MAIHCMLLTGDNIRIVQNFLSEFKDKYDCMQTFDMVRSMISAWQSANFKDGEEPTMPTKDEIEQFIQSQLGKNKQSTVASVQEYSNEEQSIIDKAKKNGTFMKAPNGKPTNLTEKQWVQVRTKAFKDWFGDWEAKVRRKNRLEVIKPYIKNVVPIKKILPFIDSGLVDAEDTPKNKLYTILTDFFNSLPIPKELNVYYLDSKIRKDLPYYKNYTGFTDNDSTGFYIIDDSNKYQYNKIDSINNNISTFIHELTHALLMKSIEENKEFRNKVQNLYNYTIQYLKNTNIYDRYNDMYGFTDIHEFISEAVSNISFMRVLDDIPSPNKEKNSIFDDFLNAIKTLFKELRGGFAGKEHSILDDIFNLFNTDNFNIYEHNNVSKVVDENGEPLVVYHYTDNENLTEFSTEFDNYFSKTGGTKNAIFFTTDNVVPGSEDNFLTSRKAKLSLFLNIKNLEVFHGTKEDLHKQGTSYREIVNKSSERKNSENGIVFTGFDDNKKENQTIYVVHNPNQIKSAINNTGEFSKNSNNIYDIDSKEAPIQENGKITPAITTEATPYTKGLPQKNPNTAYLFTENAQAYVTSLQLDDSWIERGYNKGNSVKTGVSDVRGTNQAGIRASSYNTYGATNISRNAFGIIVKKYQQKLSQSSFLSKEGQFEDTDSDFELFKQLNLHMFNNLNNFNAENIVLPNQIALGKAALPLRFTEWLKEELSKRFNANFIIEKNTRADYNGYGIRVINANIKVEEAPIQEDDKSYAEDLARCARQMSPIERKHRVERITRMFSSIVNSKLKDKLAAYNDKIQAETNPKVKNDLLFGRKKITRFSVIKSEGVQSIMMEVRKAFQVYADAPLEAKIAIEKQQILNAKPNLNDRIATNIARNVAERKTKAFQNVLNNFQVLAEEALGNLALTEGISVNLNSNFVLNTQENSDTFNEDGKQTNQGDVFEKEESLKDGWMTDVRQVATFDSLTTRVRQAIGNMVRYDSTGNVDRDDLGDNIYLNAGYVHSELIQALRNMISAEDMIPMLEQLSKKKVWVKQIINELNNDNQLFTEFYRAYRKDYVNYFIQKVSTNSDTSTSTKVMSINGAEGTSHYFDEWRDNYEYGNVLTTDSIYDKNGDIQLKNAKVGLDLVNELLDIFEDRETIAENLTDENIARIKKAMNMLGASVDSETLENALKFNLDNKAFKPAVNVLLSNLRIIYYDLNKGNEKVKDGEYIDLLNIHGTAFNNIAEVINKVDEDTIESSVRQGDKTMYAHINPSYVTTLIKKLQREDTYKQVLDDYRVCNWFNKNDKWRNSILEEIENSAEVRSNLKHVVLLQYNRKEYNAWTDLDTTLALYNMYMTGAADRSGSETYGYYQIPMLSDAQSAEFIKFKRYKKGYEEKLLDKFKDLVYQEIDRINLVKERATTKNHIDPIANFDMNGKKMGGAEFKFFPELNQKDESGKTFLQAIDEAKQISMDEVDNLIKNTIKSIMNSRFKEAIQHYKDIGLYDRIGTEKNARFKHVNVYSEEGMNDRMREWFWNSTYFTSQFIELTTTDLAYYKNLEDFQKRNKQDHAPAERLNTLATWNGKPVLVNNDGSRRTTRRVIYLKDNILPANSMDSINEILEARVKDKDDAFTAYDKAAIMSIFNKVNVADAQAYNTLPSFRSTQIMAGMWSDAEETAYNNIMNNKWTASDFLVLWNTRKPYLYTQKNQPDGMGGIMKVPTQHKNSEFLLLTGAMFGQILHSSKLQALNDFMVKNNIDSAMFESAVKDGLQGAINLNDATNYASTMAVLENATRLNGKENPNVVHEFDYNDYGIQTSTPEHGIDKVQLVGTQIRRLISSDMNPNRDPNFKLKYKDREFTQEEWMNYFNAINTANIQEAFKEVSDKFNDIHEVEKELIREVRSNPRYGTDLIRALTLDKNGHFNIPLIDPSQTLRIQALLNSILKNRVTKQKINGGALIQASPFGLDESKQPQIVYNEDGSIKYFEAYLPCPTEELYNSLLDPNTHELDINKKDSKGNYIVPEKYREVIGYRVPTEDKYSMQHIRIKGFLPRQVGSVIIMPKEITSLAGSDYDVDKIYVMFHSLFTKNNYNIKKAWDDFYQLESSKDIVDEIDKNYGEALQQYIAEQTDGEPLDSDDLNDLAEEFKGWLKDNNIKRYNLSETAQTRFSEWFNKNKSKYLINSSFSTYEYDFDKIEGNDKLSIYNNAKANSKKQRDSLMIDLMWSVLSHKDTAKSILEPGGFDKPKKAARINTILYNVDKKTLTKLGGLKGLEKLSLDELDDLADKYKEKLNPLVPTTWVTLHQRNMSGASLIPMAATNNASHALMQQTKLGIEEKYQLTFNGHKYTSLHDIKNVDGEFITRNIASFLAAFVDNAKDPIAGDMNFNEITASSAFALLRMGVGINTMSLIINQPIVRDIVKEVQNNRVSLAEAIINTINKYKNYNNGTNVNSYYTKIEDYNFKDEDLASNIIARKDADTANTSEGHEFYANQLKVGFMFAKFNKLAGDLNEFTNATRADTQNGGAGPYISSDIINIEKVEKLLMAPRIDANYSLTGTSGLLSFNLNEEGIINSPLPILQAFFTYGVESTKKLFNKYFPYYNNTYTSIISTIKDMTRYGNLNEKQRNSIYNDFISYMLAETSVYNYKDEEGNPISERKYYITKFPAEFDAFKKAHPELSQLPIINRIKYNKFTKYNPAPSLTFSNVGRITDIQKQDYIRSWETLMNINDECKDMAIKLFLYCTYKGLGFSPNGFSHLAPVAVKENTGNYVETLEDMYFEKADVTTFIGQYFRNHLDDRTLVPDITGASYVSEVNLETENFDVKIDFNSSMDDKKIAKPFDDKSAPEYLPYVHINYKGADLYFERVNGAKDLIASYQRVQPLGVKNQYVEYDSNASEDMESVVPKPQAYKANLNDYVDNTDITDNQDMANFVMEQQQSAQASLLAVIKQKAAENGYTESQPIDKLEQLPPITEDEQGNKFCEM